MSFNITPYQRRQPLADGLAPLPVASDFGRRNRLLHERQIENRRLLRQRYRLAAFKHLERRHIFAERESRPIHDHEVGQIKQPAIVFPGFDLLVHIRADHEEELGTGMQAPHRLQSFDGVSFFQSVHFYSRRSKSFKRNGRQRHHRTAVERRCHSSRLFVGGRKSGNEVNFIDLEGSRNGLSSGEMSVVNRIESPAQYGNPFRDPHVPDVILTKSK